MNVGKETQMILKEQIILLGMMAEIQEHARRKIWLMHLKWLKQGCQFPIRLRDMILAILIKEEIQG